MPTEINKDLTRRRMVIFRLSAEEYQSLRKACAAAQARNVSDYVRTKALDLIQRQELSEALKQDLSSINRNLADVRAMVKQVSEWVDARRSASDSGARERNEDEINPAADLLTQQNLLR
jgi:hypothetical protein